MASQFSQTNEGADDEHTHLDGTGTVENSRRHDGTVLGERPGADRGESQSPEVVTVCDHLNPLSLRQLKPEIGWKAFDVALHRLIEGFRRHVIDGGEIRVEHYLLAADGQYSRINERGVNRPPTQSMFRHILSLSCRKAGLQDLMPVPRRTRASRKRREYEATAIQRSPGKVGATEDIEDTEENPRVTLGTSNIGWGRVKARVDGA
jgi:hypothetical protein